MPRSSRLEDKYNNTVSGLNATNFQEAIDEIVQNTSEIRYFITNLSGPVSNLGLGSESMIIGKSSSISAIDSIASDNIIIGSNSNLSNFNGRFVSNVSNNIIIGNNAFIKAANNSIQLGTGTLDRTNSLGFLNNIIATDEGLYTSFQPTIYRATNNNVIDDHLIGIDSKFQNISISELIVPDQTETGSVVFYDGANLNTSTTLLLDQNFCSVETIDDRGYEWCNWQIGNNGSAFTSSKKSLGTKTNPTPVTDGTKIGGWGFVGDDGVTPSQSSPGYVGAEISAFAIGNQNATNGGTRLQIEVTPENSKEKQVILGTNNVGDILLPGYEETRNDGPTFTTLYTDSTGVLRHGSIPTYREVPINNSRSMTYEEFLSEGFITRYRIAADISLTPPPGGRFVPWDPNTNNYTGLPTNATYESDNLKAIIVTMFYYNTDIYITNLLPYSETLIRATSNNGSDAAINYNTTNWQAVTLSDPFSIVRVSNRYPITLTNNTFTPNYTGWFNIGYNLHIRSNGQRCHLAVRIVNTTTNEIIMVTDYTYIRVANGTNLDTLKLGNLDVPCVAGENYQVQIRRQGTVTNSATLDNTNKSFITIKSTRY